MMGVFRDLCLYYIAFQLVKTDLNKNTPRFPERNTALETQWPLSFHVSPVAVLLSLLCLDGQRRLVPPSLFKSNFSSFHFLIVKPCHWDQLFLRLIWSSVPHLLSMFENLLDRGYLSQGFDLLWRDTRNMATLKKE